MTKQKMVQYTVPLKNEPTACYRVGQILAKEGINITGLQMETVGDVAFLRFLSDKQNSVVRRPLEAAGYEIFEESCFQLDVADRPGEFAKLTELLADEDVHILNMYGTSNHGETARLIVSVDKPDVAQPILWRFAEKAHAAAA